MLVFQSHRRRTADASPRIPRIRAGVQGFCAFGVAVGYKRPDPAAFTVINDRLTLLTRHRAMERDCPVFVAGRQNVISSRANQVIE